ncbi:MAG: hypothetical protein ACXWKO_17935 [Phenylobacterium sp.]
MWGRVNAWLSKHQNLCVALLLFLGAAWRLVWVSLNGRLAPSPNESRNAALAFARTGSIADAYGPGLGPTAHVSPVMPMFAGMIYRLLGETRAAELTLAAAAIVFALASFYFLYRIFERLGAPVGWRLAALAMVCLAPLYAEVELRELRLFDGLLATATTMGLLLWIVRLDDKPVLTWRDALGVGLGTGLLALINPPAAIGCLGAETIMALRKINWRRWAPLGAVLALGIVAPLIPWGVRNEIALHHFILTRSNFGLELAQEYYPGGVNPPDLRTAFKQRNHAIHPYVNAAALAEVRRDGEFAYAARLQRETVDWMKADPPGAAKIGARALQEFWFPDPWMWRAFGTNTAAYDWFKSILVWSLTVAGFLALGWAVARREFRYLYLVPLLTLSSLPYILVQPILRYRYLVASLLTFLAVDLLRRLFSRAPKP